MRFITALSIIFLISACAGPPAQSTASRDQQYRINLSTNPSVSIQAITTGPFSLQYAESGTAGSPTIVFIHGTPGSWRSLGSMLAYPELQEKARLVSIDRPGWGGSPLHDKETEGSFAEQAKLIEPLLRQLKRESNNQALILVGHSLGASISPYIAYKYPELVDGLLMAAGAIDPELGKPRWYNHAASVWPISRLIDDRLVKANVEIWGVYEALAQLKPWWQSVTIPMIYMQGEDDELVDPRNLDFAEQSLPKTYTKIVRIPGQSHFVHRQQTELIAELTLELMDKVNSTGSRAAD